MAFDKLVEHNDWEYITVYIGGNAARAGLAALYPVMKAGEYEVQWPDGKVETLRVKMHKYTQEYDDMGHTYSTSGEKPYFQLKVNGSKVEVYAPRLGVKVWRD